LSLGSSATPRRPSARRRVHPRPGEIRLALGAGAASTSPELPANGSLGRRASGAPASSPPRGPLHRRALWSSTPGPSLRRARFLRPVRATGQVSFRPRGFSPPRRLAPTAEPVASYRLLALRACCIPLPILGFVAFLLTPGRFRPAAVPRDAFTPRRISLPTAAPGSPPPPEGGCVHAVRVPSCRSSPQRRWLVSRERSTRPSSWSRRSAGFKALIRRQVCHPPSAVSGLDGLRPPMGFCPPSGPWWSSARREIRFTLSTFQVQRTLRAGQPRG